MLQFHNKINNKGEVMNLKKITSLTMLFSMLIMVYTGIILFIAPAGRVANWSNWEILNLTKTQYGQIHSTFMVLFIIGTILHLFYNWKPITSYMKNTAKEMVFFTKDTMASLVVTSLVLLGTLYFITPFSTFLDFGEEVKESWEKDLGTAPYSHAELSSLKSFSKKVGFDLEKSKEILTTNSIVFQEEQSLRQIASSNNLSPRAVYELLKKEFEKGGVKIVEFSGLGRKSVDAVASTLGLTTTELIGKLQVLGIKAEKNDKFRTLAEDNDLSPMDVMEQLGYKKSH